MTERHSTASPSRGKPDKMKPERPDGSPLFWHAAGGWAKKIRGKLHYFGRVSHADALAVYEQEKNDLHAGRAPRAEQAAEQLTVRLLCAKFLAWKLHLKDAGELSPHTLSKYSDACKLLMNVLGRGRLVSDLRPDDFEKLRKRMARTWGPVRIGNFVNAIRTVFNYGVKNGLMAPIVYGEGFRRPSKKTLREHRQSKGLKMFEAAELRGMLDKARQPLRAMLLLGINCGFGNSDVGNLPQSALDLAGGWVTYPRPKTAIERRIPLWPETVEALREWSCERPEARKPEHAGLVFITAKGGCWARQELDSPVSKETAKLLKACGLNGHRGFYCLRHTFQTIGDNAGDFIAVRKIMGHATDDIGDVYRERVPDDRLQRVTDHVRGWLFGVAEKKPQSAGRRRRKQAEAPEGPPRPAFRLVGTE